MKSFFLTSLFALLIIQVTNAQEPIDVAESTLKVSGLADEFFYYGFCEGDQIVFNFEVVKGKNLKEVEIIALPSSSKFMDYKTKKIKNKVIQVTKTGIYKFKFSNSSISGRICKFKIQRIPVDESTKNFNTTVYQKTMRDTTYYTENEKYLIAVDTIIVPVITHHIERVHSKTAMNGKPNKSTVAFNLPKNTIFWSYYLGVGESSEAIFQKAEQKAKKQKEMFTTASSAASAFIKVDPSGSAALASVALRGWAEFGVNSKADNIEFYITDYNNANFYMSGTNFSYFEKGNSPLSYRRMNPLTGTLYICMKNDNVMDGIDVHVRISAVTVEERWGTREVKKQKINSWIELYLKN